jgi:hypothetical protein
MINGTNVLREDKTRWTSINMPETLWAVPRVDGGIIRRIGAALFKMHDAEARWRGWLITELWGGLARRYRDARFDTWTGMPDDESGRP